MEQHDLDDTMVNWVETSIKLARLADEWRQGEKEREQMEKEKPKKSLLKNTCVVFGIHVAFFFLGWGAAYYFFNY